MNTTSRKRKKTPHQPVGRWIRVDKRLAIYLRDDFTCLLCGTGLTDVAPAEITLDHVKPRSKGGTNDERNLFTCCRSCNSSRQDQPLHKFASSWALYAVRLNTRRKLTKYLALARSILEDKRKL